MRIAFGLVVFLAACGNSPDMLPVGGGSSAGFPDSGGNTQVDARMVDAKVADAKPLAIDAALFNGRVCLLTDARDFESCASTGANGLTVHIGSSAAVTAADGTFTIAAPTEATSNWSVTGSNIVTSIKVKADYVIPAMTTTMFNQLKTANNVTIGQGNGSVMAHVIRNGVGYAGCTALSTSNTAAYFAFYDNPANQFTWTQTATANKGSVWLANMDVGSTTFTITPTTGTAISVAAQPVVDQAITWVDVIFNQ